MISFVILSAGDIPKSELTVMFKLRYKVTVEDWGWNIPTVKDGIDQDQFDTDRTIYILVYRNDGKMVACSRLNPTTEPHLLSDIFPHHCDLVDVPRSESIWELSRFVVDKDELTHYQQVQLYLQMCLAITKYAVSNGIEQLTWLSHKTRYTKSIIIWKTRPLGLPRYYEDEGEDYIAAIMDTTPDAITQLLRFVKEDWSEPLGTIPSHSPRRAA